MNIFNKKIKLVLICTIILIPLKLSIAAFESYPISTSNLGFGKIALSARGNLIDIFNEPSSLIHFQSVGGEVIWNKPFQISELQQTAFATGFMYKNWGFGVSAGTFGNKIYNESMVTITGAQSFKDRLDFGINISVYQLKIDDYGTDHTFGITASMRYSINDAWDWVSTARNINFPQIGSSEENLPQIVTTGFIGNVREMITVATEWEQDIEFDGTLKFGVMVQPIEQIYFSLGYVSNPGQFTAGFSLNINKLYIEYGTIAYNDIGLFTHQLGIGVNLNRL